ncbi:hypothetical protein SMICM17S_03447 [Streptomyces microflavus]
MRETMAQIEGAEGIARRGLVMKLLASLKQVCNHPAQYLKEEPTRLTGRSGKLARTSSSTRSSPRTRPPPPST